LKIIKAHPALSSTNKSTGGESKGDKDILHNRHTIKEDRHPLDRGGVIKKEGRGIYGGDERGYKGDLRSEV
jgi:hypothetical protein